MANSLLKWCKTKILHGYRQINVEGHDEVLSGNRSDTEFLVRSSDDEFLLTPTGSRAYPSDIVSINEPDLSSAVTSSPKLSLNRSRRVIDWKGEANMSCELSLPENASENQEFAFTLYDFHGQGRVTKDDITSLVQSIYDTVGSSMSLPPSGSRTVKVKLSVTPSQKGLHIRQHKTMKGPLNYNTPRNSPRTLFNSDSCSSQGESPRYYCDESSWSNSFRSSPNVTPRQNESPRVRESLTSPRQEVFVGEEMTFSPTASRRNSSSPSLENDNGDCSMTPRYHIECEEGEILEIKGTSSKSSRKQKKVHYQREELLRLIQASMEKNNLHYPPLRNSSCGHSHSHNHYRRRKKRYHHHHNNSSCCNSNCCCRCNCSSHQQPRYQNNSQLDPAALAAKLIHYDHSINNSNYEDLVSAEALRSNTYTSDLNDSCNKCQKYNSPINKKSNHHRSRSQDLNSDSPHVFRHHLLEAPSVCNSHPLPPSNTPDRPTSPHVSYHSHNHQHSHNHFHQHNRLRSRSCETEDAFKERLSSTTTTSTTSEDTVLSIQHPNSSIYPSRKSKEHLTHYFSNIFSKPKEMLDNINDNEALVSDKNSINYYSEYNSHNINNGDIFQHSQQSSVEADANVMNSTLKSTSSCTFDNLIVATKNLGLDDSTSSSTSGCGRSHHVHQHYHHHYHHYPSTPLII